MCKQASLERKNVLCGYYRNKNCNACRAPVLGVDTQLAQSRALLFSREYHLHSWYPRSEQNMVQGHPWACVPIDMGAVVEYKNLPYRFAGGTFLQPYV